MEQATPVNDLRRFLARLESRQALHRIAVQVDADLEIAAITDRVCKHSGEPPALLFEQVRGYRIPVATNLFGSMRRAAWALGLNDIEAAAQRLATGIAGAAGVDAACRLRCLLRQPEYAPALQARADWQDRSMPGPDLDQLPALRCWPGDGGRYLTLPQVVTRHPDGGTANVGIYRVQLLGPRRAALHWRDSSDAARHCRAWHRRGLPMPVSIAMGGDPALLFAAAFPLPPDTDEAALAGLLGGRPMIMSPSAHSDLPVPSAAEFVIEGLAYPGETALEGPFGNHTGFYQPASRVPLLRIVAISQRCDPLLPATVVGPPPTENCILGQTVARLLVPLLRSDHPDIVDIHMPVEGIFHGAALIAVRSGTDGRALLQALWRSGPLRAARLLVVTEADRVPDPGDFFWRVLNRLRPDRDLLIHNGCLGIDATVALPDAPTVEPDTRMAEQLQRRWREYGFH